MSKRNKKSNKKYKRNHKKRSNINRSNEQQFAIKDEIFRPLFTDHFVETIKDTFIDFYEDYNHITKYKVCFNTFREKTGKEDLTLFDFLDMILKCIFRYKVIFNEKDVRERYNIDINEWYDRIVEVFEEKYMDDMIDDYYYKCSMELTEKEYLDYSTPFCCCVPFVPFCVEYIVKFLKEEKLIKED